MSEIIKTDHVIVGGGLSGLACAQLLEKSGQDWCLIEAESELGGRVRTDRSQPGFLLDRGFQVLNTAYPALSRCLDLEALQLGHFSPGADVYLGGRFHRIGDPQRELATLGSTLSAPVGKLDDKLKILKLKCYAQDPSKAKLVASLSTEEFLAQFGFSKQMMDRFFRPFFGGVFLEEELQTTAAKFLTLFSYFNRGLASLPRNGMQAIPEQMASLLPKERLHTNCSVRAWKKNLLESDSKKFKTKNLILAGWAIQNLLLADSAVASHSAHTHYFSAPSAQGFGSSYLRLNGERIGSLQTVAINSSVQRSYAPTDSELVVASTRGPSSPSQVLEELMGWFGEPCKEWQHLKTDHIEEALPVEQRPFSGPSIRLEKGFRVICCGDHTTTGSIQGALDSGRRAAQLALGGSAG